MAVAHRHVATRAVPGRQRLGGLTEPRVIVSVDSDVRRELREAARPARETLGRTARGVGQCARNAGGSGTAGGAGGAAGMRAFGGSSPVSDFKKATMAVTCSFESSRPSW